MHNLILPLFLFVGRDTKRREREREGGGDSFFASNKGKKISCLSHKSRLLERNSRFSLFVHYFGIGRRKEMPSSMT